MGASGALVTRRPSELTDHRYWSGAGKHRIIIGEQHCTGAEVVRVLTGSGLPQYR